MGNSAWDERSREADDLIDQLTRLGDHRAVLSRQFTEPTLDRDVAVLLEEYKVESAKFLRFFSARYRYLKREIGALYKSKPPGSVATRIADLEKLVALHALREHIRGAEPRARRLFGIEWSGPDADPTILRTFADWLVGFRRRLREGSIAEAAIDLIADGRVDHAAIDQAVQAARDAMEAFSQRHAELVTRIKLRSNMAFGCEPERVALPRPGRALAHVELPLPPRLEAARPLLESTLADGAVPKHGVGPGGGTTGVGVDRCWCAAWSSKPV